MFSSAEPELSCMEKCEMFLKSYWRGVTIVAVPIIVIFIFMIFKDDTKYSPNYLCGLLIVIVALFWMTECMSLTVASIIPLFALPLFGLLSATETMASYINDLTLLFLGSLFLAFAFELSGVHKRLVYCFISFFGYSHYKLLFGMSFFTMFTSMWISNTAATSMMMPITFTILQTVEKKGYGAMFFYKDNEKIPTDITICYFCAITFSATIGGIGSLIGTGTNLAFKGLLETAYPASQPEEVITFGLFSGFTIPLMAVLFMANYFWFIFLFFGCCRPNSSSAKKALIPRAGVITIKKAILDQRADLGDLTYMENMVLGLLVFVIILFYTRYPHQLTLGWMTETINYFNVKEYDLTAGPYIRDASTAMAIAGLMFLIPSAMVWLRYFTAEYKSDLPKSKQVGLLDFYRTHNIMPWGFAFLLGAGFALTSASAKTEMSKFVTNWLQKFKFVHRNMVVLALIIITMFLTNFASNIVVANIMCPFSMYLAQAISVSPHWLSLICGISASFCFVMPYGTPGNRIVKKAIGMPLSKMIIAGTGTTIITIIITWIFFIKYMPIVWKNHAVATVPPWAVEK